MDSDSQLLNLWNGHETRQCFSTEQVEQTPFDTGQFCLLHMM